MSVANDPMRAVTCCDVGACGADIAASATTSSNESSSADNSDIAQPKSTCAAWTAPTHGGTDSGERTRLSWNGTTAASAIPGAKISSMALNASPIATMMMPSHCFCNGTRQAGEARHGYSGAARAGHAAFPAQSRKTEGRPAQDNPPQAPATLLTRTPRSRLSIKNRDRSATQVTPDALMTGEGPTGGNTDAVHELAR